MSAEHHDLPKTTVPEVAKAILGALIAPTIVLTLIAKYLLTIDAGHDVAAASDEAAVAARIAPVAQVVVADAASGPHVDKSGEEVYQAVCLACHDAGALGSPKLGDKAAWSPRIAQGYETLIKHAIEGIRSMPARGGNPDLTDGEIANAVAFMANKAGANFTPPAAGAAPAPAEASEPTTTSTAPAAASPAPVAEKVAVAAVEAKPVEAVAEAKPAAAAGKSGEEVFNGVCMACHAAGLMGAPKPGDNAAWAPRIAQGYDTLVQHAVKGIRMMPAKGGNAALSDDEVAAAVKYMANKSGASF